MDRVELKDRFDFEQRSQEWLARHLEILDTLRKFLVHKALTKKTNLLIQNFNKIAINQTMIIYVDINGKDVCRNERSI